MVLRDAENNHADTLEESYEARARGEIEAGLAEIEAGRIFSGEKIIEWLCSWGTDHQLPPPQRDYAVFEKLALHQGSTSVVPKMV
ncbi:MAG: hypothetical protein P4L26_17425 [Terracidiphilus sp.]|nr:hypothetical protein [Terracidiphilus sp.]